ncbi:hypothetical protein [Aestuariispira insulae]|uniref:Uncharacterized protein n=1 Tax=Aestuariispira insulae TaxID=1461337 RepID=A0A3D9HF23_9PROT|nr:hypothetical protein [Aestuariispira insulae]RED48087.1 hypothetical protein DFP90_108105 [Aestuariispira insulae]
MTLDTDDAVAVPLPVFDLLGQAYGQTFRHVGALILVSWFPALIFLLLMMSLEFVDDLVDADSFWPAGLKVTSALIWVPMMTTWQRCLLQGREEVVGWKPLRLRREEFYFLCLFLFLGFVIGVPVFFTGFIPYGWAAAALVALWVVSRSILMFPAMALQVEEGSWVIVEATKKRSFKIGTILLLNIAIVGGLFSSPYLLVEFLDLYGDLSATMMNLLWPIWITVGGGVFIATTLAIACLLFLRLRPLVVQLEDDQMYDYSGK